VARLLQKQPAVSDVLHVGNAYIHCGQPMKPGELRLSALTMTAGDPMDAPAISIESTTLQCPCGFKMAIPTH
jgi:hypothetical protein